MCIFDMFRKRKEELKGETELTDSDKLRHRKQKKANKAGKQKEYEAKQAMIAKYVHISHSPVFHSYYCMIAANACAVLWQNTDVYVVTYA